MGLGLRTCTFLATLLTLIGCGGLIPEAQTASPAVPAEDPTELSRCKVAASAANPLVTEWPASEKAHLQSLASGQLVAVEYSGCEMRIVDGCSIPGSYQWSRTTLATDTVDIGNADELYAKLPLGAVSLEGELERSGHLAVKTTVAGQMQMVGYEERRVPRQGPCGNATHVIGGISVGAFKLLSGEDVSGGGEVGVSGIGAQAKSKRSQSTLKEAGVHDLCPEATDEAPHSQCASPIQVFLKPLRIEEEVRNEQTARQSGSINISFAAPEDPEERWTLRNGQGDPLCTIPCSQWVGPASGYYLQREQHGGYDLAVVNLPEAFPFKPGSQVGATYQEERGWPRVSTWTWWFGGLPTGILAAVVLTFGTVQLVSGADCERITDCPLLGGPGLNITMGVVYGSMAGTSFWWWRYSHKERVDLYEGSVPQEARNPFQIMLGPTGVKGTF